MGQLVAASDLLSSFSPSYTRIFSFLHSFISFCGCSDFPMHGHHGVRSVERMVARRKQCMRLTHAFTLLNAQPVRHGVAAAL